MFESVLKEQFSTLKIGGKKKKKEVAESYLLELISCSRHHIWLKRSMFLNILAVFLD